jgi:hypothetical protein
MRESSGRIALAVREATAATQNQRALLAQRNRLTRLIYWTDRMIEELETQNQSSTRRVGKRSIEKLERLADALPFPCVIRSTQRTRPVKVLDELFDIQARLLELKVGDLAPELRRFDETVDEYYGWSGYQTERLDPAG